MKKTYRGILKNDTQPNGKQRVIVNGNHVTFHNGIATRLTESVARELMLRGIIGGIEEEIYLLPEFSHVEELPELMEAEEEDPEEIESEQLVEYDLPPLPEFEAVEDEEEKTGNENITKERIHELYGELGTWTAVAAHLGITTAEVKRFRDL